MPPAVLHLWLPSVQTPSGWVDITSVATVPVTRMLVRRAGRSGPWDATELLNLYRVPGAISADTVLDNADRALRDSSARDIHTYRRDDVPTAIDGLLAVRAGGRLVSEGREVEVAYCYYAINSSAGAALIEQATVVGADSPAAVALEVDCLAEGVYQSVLVSLHGATVATQPHEVAAIGNPLAVVTQAEHLTTRTVVASTEPHAADIPSGDRQPLLKPERQPSPLW
jgi:hypothetical protein